jgi:hypothetical protein
VRHIMFAVIDACLGFRKTALKCFSVFFVYFKAK